MQFYLVTDVEDEYKIEGTLNWQDFFSFFPLYTMLNTLEREAGR
jgi:hypothetical protein